MNQQRLPAIALVVLVALLAGAGAYVLVTRQSEMVTEQQMPGPVAQQPTPSGATNIVPPSAPRGEQTTGWKTYRSDMHELTFKYPPNFPSPREVQQASGQYAITIGDLELQYFSPESNRVAGYTLPQFTRIPWLHQADDPYTEIIVGGARAAFYDLIVPSYPRGEEEPVRGYTRTLQVGLETPRGGFLEMSANSALLPDEAAARNTDLSWFQILLSTVTFTQ